MIKAQKFSGNRTRLALFLAFVFVSIFVFVLFLYSKTDAHKLAVSAIRAQEASNTLVGENMWVVPVGVGFKGVGLHQCISASYLVHSNTGWLSAQVRLTRLSGKIWLVREITFGGEELKVSCYSSTAPRGSAEK